MRTLAKVKREPGIWMTEAPKPTVGPNDVLIRIRKTAIDWTKVIFKGLVIKGIYGREMFETWYKMIALIQAGLDLTPMITHRFDVKDYLEGFKTMGSGKSGKVVLTW